jgi:hypothetical protein
MWTTRSRAWERTLVAECEAFLTGHYVDRLLSEGRLVPSWAWLNLLAHGTESEIGACAETDGTDGAVGARPDWHLVLAFLAQELLAEAARQGVAVAELQRRALVPLELALIGSRTRSIMAPPAFVSEVRQALAQGSSSRRG